MDVLPNTIKCRFLVVSVNRSLATSDFFSYHFFNLEAVLPVSSVEASAENNKIIVQQYTSMKKTRHQCSQYD